MSISLTKALPTVSFNERGSSMLEVMTVVVIIGITAAIAVPNYLVWNRTSQLRQAATDLQSNLALARMTAMNVNSTVTMTIGPIACPPDTVSCGVIGATFTRVLNTVPPATVLTVPSIPLASRNITASLVTGGTTVQISSLGLRIGGPVPPAPDLNQYVTLTNTDNLTYSIVVTPGGKVRWCAAARCS